MKKETYFVIFQRKSIEKIGKRCCRKFSEKFFNQVFVKKTVDKATDQENTKMTSTVSTN